MDAAVVVRPGNPAQPAHEFDEITDLSDALDPWRERELDSQT
jgi:hypothetical protein